MHINELHGVGRFRETSAAVPLSWCSRTASGWFAFRRQSVFTLAITAASAFLAG